MRNLKGALLIALITFFIAMLVTLISQARIEDVTFVTAVIILLVVIFVGVIFDMVGVAATVTRVKTFNAMASKKVFGARHGLYLARHGDRVASFMCDIVGDICGTVSGAISAVIVFRIVRNWGGPRTLINLVIIGIASALTVGGKAFCKAYGINRSHHIILFVARIMAGCRYSRDFLYSKLKGESNNG